MVPRRIYLSGGGVCAMAHVGALLELSEHIPLQGVKEWMGVSAGSLVCMCICCGYTLEELMHICRGFDFINICDMDSIQGWILRMGLDTGERLLRLVKACLHVKGLSSEITFKELYERSGLSLRVMATDLNEGKPVVFHHETTPHYCVSHAIRASMSLPYYFQPFYCPDSGHYLIDGGVISNYPMFLLSKEEQRQTIGILIPACVNTVEDIDALPIDEAVIRPMNIAFQEKIKIETELYHSGCIQIHLADINIIDFSFEDETKDRIIAKGREAVRTFLAAQPRPRRRNSI